MSRFLVEYSMTIVADTEADAEALAQHVAECTTQAHRYKVDGGPDAVVASMSVEVVMPKPISRPFTGKEPA